MLTQGESFGSYRVIREIGRGAMGAVFEAEHVQLRKRVAIKVLLPEAAADPAAVQRFLREGEAAARIRHEHIVDVSDVGTRDGSPYLVMEYLDGESLAQRLTRKRRLEDVELADLVIPVCDALALAHEAGVIHRDVKPENIFLARTARGATRAMLVDFGISHVAHHDPKVARLTSSSVLIGTPCYLSPEAARSARSVDARSDQYSLGVTLYECRTGLLPYERASIFEMISAILMEDPPLPSDRTPGVDPRMEELILRAMSRAPDDRYPDLRALALALLPMASPAVRAQWEPELRARGDARRTPVGALELRDRRHGDTTALDLAHPDDQRALAPTDPEGLVPPADAGATLRPALPTPEPVIVRAPIEAAPLARPTRRRWWLGAGLVASAAAAMVALVTSRRPAAPAAHAAVARAATAPLAPALAPPVTVVTPAAPAAAPPVAPPVATHPRRGASHGVRRPVAPSPHAAEPASVAPPTAAPAAPTPTPTPPRSLLRTDFGGPTP